MGIGLYLNITETTLGIYRRVTLVAQEALARPQGKEGVATKGLQKTKNLFSGQKTPSDKQSMDSSKNKSNPPNRDGTQGSENKSVHSNPSDEIKSSRKNLTKYTEEFEEASKKRVNLKNNYTKATW